MSLVKMEWPIFSLVAGRLIDECGYNGPDNWPSFATEEDAEAYLEEHDIRGTVL